MIALHVLQSEYYIFDCKLTLSFLFIVELKWSWIAGRKSSLWALDAKELLFVYRPLYSFIRVGISDERVLFLCTLH